MLSNHNITITVVENMDIHNITFNRFYHNFMPGTFVSVQPLCYQIVFTLYFTTRWL